MLQQTTVSAVQPYFEEFRRRWPKITDLAAEELDRILQAWAGLGYYARARNLHKCAREVVARYGGSFPEDETSLLGLPGIGPYTAAAISAIAFGKRATPVDGNVERVLSRLFAVSRSRKELQPIAASITPDRRCGDYAQAVMDLGAMICRPRAPACTLCPWRGECRAAAEGRAEAFPVRPQKPDRPARYGVVFWIRDPEDRVLLRRRPESGLLGGMMEFPSTAWRSRPWDDPLAEAPADPQAVIGTVRHAFTHFHLELTVVAIRVREVGGLDGMWCPVDELDGAALPSVMKKVARLMERGPES